MDHDLPPRPPAHAVTADAGAPRRLRVLIAVVGLLGLGSVAAVVIAEGVALGPLYLVVLFAAAMGFTGVMPFVVARRSEGEEVTAEDALVVVMLVSLPAAGVTLAALAGCAIVHTFRRRSAAKALYNHSVQAISVSAAIGTWSLLGGADVAPRSSHGLVAAAIAAFVYGAGSARLTELVVAVATGTPLRRVVADGLGTDLITTALVVGWGVLAAGSAKHDAAAVALVAVPMTGSWLLRRSERQRAAMQALLDAALDVGSAVRHGTVASALTDATDRVLVRVGSRVARRPPAEGEIGVALHTRSGQRWLVAGRRHGWDRAPREDDVLLGALAAIGEIALENATLLDQAGRDPDTGLVTGALLQDRLQAMLDQHGDDGVVLAVVRIPRFDMVKRTLGPGAARRELAVVASRMRLLGEELGRAERTPVLVGHLGGGDFGVAVAARATTDRALGIARMAERELLRPVVVDGVELAIEPAIGVRSQASPRRVGVSASQLLTDVVSAAAIAAQRRGRSRIELVERTPEIQADSELALESRLRAALGRDELVVHYQPVISVGTGALVGAEALVRWRDPERGLIGPGEFVPVAEASTLIVDLDRHVMRRTIQQVAEWSIAGLPDGFAVAVNLSAVHLSEPDTADVVARLLDAAGVEGRMLRVEVTESSVMTEASSALATLDALAERGIGISVDDFGTGYSSLLYLRDFPVSQLKIDRSFVSRMTESGGDAAIVAAIVRLAQTLGLRTVAEGVETEEQLAALRSLGCDAGQGFLWGPAVGPSDFSATWLAAPSAVEASDGRDDGSGAAVAVPEEAWHRAALRDDELASVVHELRTPLTAIGGFAHLVSQELARLDEPGDLALYVERIEHGVRTLQGLIDALHDSSTSDLGGMALDLQLVDANAFVRTTVAAVAPALLPHPLHVHSGPSAEVRIDQVRIGQVLRNLLSNAAKFSDPEAPIDISVTTSGSRCTVTVRDHGAGVPTDRRGELFRRFARLGVAQKGMGLGLHTSRTIARRHGGDVTHRQPEDGPGSIFALDLPIDAGPD